MGTLPMAKSPKVVSKKSGVGFCGKVKDIEYEPLGPLSGAEFTEELKLPVRVY
jgi:hypothetical protein